jgi:hypothetical protein
LPGFSKTAERRSSARTIERASVLATALAKDVLAKVPLGAAAANRGRQSAQHPLGFAGIWQAPHQMQKSSMLGEEAD